MWKAVTPNDLPLQQMDRGRSMFSIVDVIDATPVFQ
jgi:hypothetical protein